jgi:hypothetical protein
MTDLIQRLRRVVSECNEGIPIFAAVVHPSMLHEAADELERLTRERAECASTLAHATRLLNDALESKTALSAALERIVTYTDARAGLTVGDRSRAIIGQIAREALKRKK